MNYSLFNRKNESYFMIKSSYTTFPSNGGYTKVKRTSFNPHTDFVGLDCLALPQNFSGAAYYIYHMTQNILQSNRRFPVALICKGKHQHYFSSLLQPQDKLITIPIQHRAEQLYFYEFKLKDVLIRERIRIFYATHYLCPPPNDDYYLISTFHDMGFLLFPNFYPISKRIYFGLRMKTFLKRANWVITVSEATATAIKQLFPEHCRKVSVIYPGTDHLLSEKSIASANGKVRQPYILVVNTFEKRKNIPFVIKVFNRLKEYFSIPHQLVLIGHPANGQGEIMKEIKKSPFKSQISIAHSISVEELNDYYRHCDFFISASKYEGFGFTPYEAVNHNAPAFFYRNEAVIDVLGEHPYTFDHFKVDSWAEFIHHEYLNHFPGKISADRIQHLTWKNAVQKTVNFLNQIALTEEASIVS